MVVIESNPIYELGPRFAKTKGREVVTTSGVNGENLPETPTPDSAEELQRKKKILLASFLADQNCHSGRSDPDI
jgi:hypothetical protein